MSAIKTFIITTSAILAGLSMTACGSDDKGDDTKKSDHRVVYSLSASDGTGKLDVAYTELDGTTVGMSTDKKVWSLPGDYSGYSGPLVLRGITVDKSRTIACVITIDGKTVAEASAVGDVRCEAKA